MTPIRGGTTVERDPNGCHRSVSVVTDEGGDAAVYVDGHYVGGIYRAFVGEGREDEWIVCPTGVEGALDDLFELGVEAVDALVSWHFENREGCEIIPEEWEDE